MQLIFLILILLSALLIVGGIVVLNLGRQDRRRRMAAHKTDLLPNVMANRHTISTILTASAEADTPQSDPPSESLPSAHALETALGMGPAILSAAGIQPESETQLDPQQTLFLLQGAEALCTLSQAITKLEHVKTDEKRTALLKDIKACIQVIDTEMVRNGCMTAFDKRYPSFCEGLLAQAPDLTEADLRLCAFLALGQSSKDMAALTRRSIRTIETTTYHLRKKLAIPTEEKTVDFLKRFLA